MPPDPPHTQSGFIREHQSRASAAASKRVAHHDLRPLRGYAAMAHAHPLQHLARQRIEVLHHGVYRGAEPVRSSLGRYRSLVANFATDDIKALRALGGDVILSFGGANGIELAQSCKTVSTLQAQYQAVIDLYGPTRIDFDIEGAAQADPASIDLRNKAVAGLQSAARAAGRQLMVQFTLPVLPTGLTADGAAVLQNALQNGVDLAVLNLMAMDNGGPGVA